MQRIEEYHIMIYHMHNIISVAQIYAQAPFDKGPARACLRTRTYARTKFKAYAVDIIHNIIILIIIMFPAAETRQGRVKGYMCRER